MILGIDGFDPELIRQWINEMPNLKEMQEKGLWGAMESTVPPAAACAWTCVQCGRNPGSYGFWDSTYRDDFSYGGLKLASSIVQAIFWVPSARFWMIQFALKDNPEVERFNHSLLNIT